jgi:hypothetical protein
MGATICLLGGLCDGSSAAEMKLELYWHAIASPATADVALASIDGLRDGILSLGQCTAGNEILDGERASAGTWHPFARAVVRVNQIWPGSVAAHYAFRRCTHWPLRMY